MDLIPWRWKRKEKETPREEEHKGNEMTRFRSEMDQLFERFFGDPWESLGRPFGGLEEWNPSLDVKETENTIEVRAEVPGVMPEDLNVTLVDNVLTVEGVKSGETERKAGEAVFRECSYGRFKRSIPLAAEVEAQKVEAEHKNGVVTIRMRKSRSTPAKRIPIKVG